MTGVERARKYRERHEVRKSIEKYKGAEGIDYVECKICGKRGLYIDVRHLKTRHSLKKEEYIRLFPNAKLYSTRKSESQSRPNNSGNSGKRFSRMHRDKLSLARRNGVSWDKEKLDAYDGYKAYVRYLTNKNYCKYYYSINPKSLKRGDKYHLDHIYSVYRGFVNNVPPETISHRFNLRIVDASKNESKAAQCGMTLARLYQIT